MQKPILLVLKDLMLDHPLAAPLDRIHELIDLVQHLRHRVRGSKENHDPDTKRSPPVVRAHGLHQLLLESEDHLLGRCTARFRQEDGKLIPTQPRDRIDDPQIALDRAGDQA